MEGTVRQLFPECQLLRQVGCGLFLGCELGFGDTEKTAC